MEEIEKTARELILAITEKTLKSLNDKGLLKEPSKLQMLCSSPEMTSLIKKLSTPKYDPNRKFRKGDIVEMDTHGRDVAASLKKEGVELGKRYTVTEDESNTGYNIGYVSFIGDDGIEHHSMFFWLKLITPEEELEPFYIEKHGEKTGGLCYTVHKRGGYAESSFYYGTCRTRDEAQAKAAAEAERDRLNAEHRKEQNNGAD